MPRSQWKSTSVNAGTPPYDFDTDFNRTRGSAIRQLQKVRPAASRPGLSSSALVLCVLSHQLLGREDREALRIAGRRVEGFRQIAEEILTLGEVAVLLIGNRQVDLLGQRFAG